MEMLILQDGLQHKLQKVLTGISSSIITTIKIPTHIPASFMFMGL